MQIPRYQHRTKFGPLFCQRRHVDQLFAQQCIHPFYNVLYGHSTGIYVGGFSSDVEGPHQLRSHHE